MAQLSVFEMQTDRMLALEFMREHLDHEVEVHNFSIVNPKGFGSVIASKRLIRTINDIRDFLRHANIPFLVPNPDPYNATAHEDRKAAKLARHFDSTVEVYSVLADKYTRMAEAAKAGKEAVTNTPEDGSSKRVIAYRTAARVQDQISHAAANAAKRPLPTDYKVGTARDELPREPPAKSRHQPVLARCKVVYRDYPEKMSQVFTEEFEILTAPPKNSLYDDISSDEEDLSCRRVVRFTDPDSTPSLLPLDLEDSGTAEQLEQPVSNLDQT